MKLWVSGVSCGGVEGGQSTIHVHVYVRKLTKQGGYRAMGNPLAMHLAAA